MRRRIHTRLGVISDVHGDFAALREALEQLARLNVSEVVCADDLLDWGPSPGRCIELLHKRRIPCVAGNPEFLDAGGGVFDPVTFPSGKAIAFLDAMPRSWERTSAGIRVTEKAFGTGVDMAQRKKPGKQKERTAEPVGASTGDP